MLLFRWLVNQDVIRFFKNHCHSFRLKIVDDTEDIFAFGRGKDRMQILPEAASTDEEDELPVFAGVVDERPAEVQAMEEFKVQSKWKKIADDEEDEAGPSHCQVSKMDKTLDGKQAGLQRASALRGEMMEHRQKETRFFETVCKDLIYYYENLNYT